MTHQYQTTMEQEKNRGTVEESSYPCYFFLNPSASCQLALCDKKMKFSSEQKNK